MRCAINHRKSEQGYTLIEMAMVMLIVGIIVSGGLFVWHLYKVEQRKEITETNRFRISLNLEDFKSLYGRYPCPARYDAVRGDADYGVEGDCTDVSVPPGTCANGYCVEESQRTIFMPDGTEVTPRVRRGAIPFRTLFMEERDSYDAYNARYSYAVTEVLTDWQTFSSARGGISIVDNQIPVSNSVVEPAHSGLYFVFSHGSDSIGAYNVQGQLLQPCNGPMLDNENCNTSATERFATYRSSVHSEVPPTIIDAGAVVPGGGAAVDANTRYDDNVFFAGIAKNPIWRISDADRDDVHDVLPDADRLITIGDAVPEQEVNVDDVTRVSPNPDQQGLAQTNALCAENSADGDCFDPSLIGGEEGTNQCEEDEVGRGVGSSRFRCGPLSEAVVACPEGGPRFIVGFDSSGLPICGNIDVPDDCGSRSVNMCGLSLILNPARHGATQTLTAGASRSQLWRCDDGRWRSSPATGVCTCTPSVTVTNPACGPGFTGTATQTVTTVCPSGETTTTVDRAECVCVGRTETQTRECPAPREGTQTRARDFACNASGALTPGAWGEWGPECACPAQEPETRDVACPGNLTGTATETRTLDTASCSWSAWVRDDSGCSCATRTETRDIGCTAPLTGTIRQQRTLQCPDATWGGWADVSENCSCNDSFETRERECPTGLIGIRTERRPVDCNGTPRGGWEQASSTCTSPPVYRWSIFGNSTGTSATRGPREGDECDNPGAVGTCSVPGAGAGQFFRYPCRCQ